MALFHPVVRLPEAYEVLDFSGPPSGPSTSSYTIGRYNEKRPGLYTQGLFGSKRDIHMGIDIGAPSGTPVFAFADCEILHVDDNRQAGDYGPTVVTRQSCFDREMYALYGHLTRASLFGKHPGLRFAKGELLGWIGDEAENGGWPPHVHFQLSWMPPDRADMPGVVADEDREEALRIYPDPRLVLGPLY